MKLLLRTLLACILVAVFSPTARAAIIINTDQSASGSLGTINLPSGVTGLFIQGTANGGAILAFTGNETLSSPSNGQARIEAQDGSFLVLDMRFTLGQLFDRIVFNLDAAADGSVTVQAISQANVIAATQAITLSGNGQNFINVVASGGDHILAVLFNSGVNLDSIAQVRVNALEAGINANSIPEPSTFAMVGCGLLGLGVLTRKRL